MRYVSTRGAWAGDPRPFSSILLEGLAPDGGLAVPQAYPRLTAAEREALRPLPYRGVALRCCRASSPTFRPPTSRR